MKFMKLGSKPDVFHTGGDNIRYVTSELANDITICVGDVKFYLHKFPLLSKSARLQKLVASANGENNEEIDIHDIPGGPVAFEICAKFCYGMTVTLNAYNVVAARCAAEYLEMYETIEKGNLVYKIEVFLNSSIFRSWKDSIIVLQTTKSLLPWSDELKVVNHCLDSIASKASIDTSKVEWSYTYNRKKLPSENGKDVHWNGVKTVPRDWWVEDLCELQLDSFKRVITTIKSKGRLSSDIIGEALRAYAFRRLPGFSRGTIQSGDAMKNQALVETIISLLPTDRGSVSCGFLIMLLKAAIVLECGEKGRRRLMKRIGCQLEEATVTDILVTAPEEELCMYDVDLVSCLVEEFVLQDHSSQDDSFVENELPEIRSQGFLADASKETVAKLVDCYLAEVSKDPNLPLSKFTDLAEMVSGFSRPSHDGLYRAIDMYLKVHPEITKSDRKRICRLMDCRKLSVDACAHAVQNERLPLRVVVQVLFFEQVRATASSSNGSTPPELPGPVQALLPDGSHGSSRSVATTNTDDHWDAVPTAEELKALKGGITKLRLGQAIEAGDNDNINPHEKVTGNKMKSIVSKKIFSKMWSGKDRSGGNSSSDTSESHASTSAEGTKSTPSRSRRQ